MFKQSFYRRALFVGAFVLSAVLQAASLPDQFAEREIVGDLDPTSMSFAPDGRLFVCEKSGTIRVIKHGHLLPDPFLVLTVNNENERGLQSIAFDPEFETNGYVYVYYSTADAPVRNRVSRFSANGDVVTAGSEVVLLETEPLLSGVHNGGAMHFKDGLLYLGTGESGVGAKSQDLSSKLGKILRIQPNGEAAPSNPFVNVAGADPTIWAYGLRNPFTFAFDESTGKMFINDVGQAQWEEINEGKAGANYGWPASEGPSDSVGVESPFYAYDHGFGCAITGGAFYNPIGQEFPEVYAGRYFFADYCSGTMWTIDPEDSEDVWVFATEIDRCIDIDIAPDGSLYYIARGGMGGGSEEDNEGSDNGRIFQVTYTGSRAPSISVPAEDVLSPVGEMASFTVAASGSRPLTFQWYRNGELIEGATAARLDYGPVSIEDDGATFTCEVGNTFGHVESDPAILSVTTNTRPVPVILTPHADMLYRAGEVISFSGEATDAEDGPLPASSFTWQIVFHHDSHTHPAMGTTSGVREGLYRLPNTNETSANVWYRVYLTVQDSGGLSKTVYRDIYPHKVNLSFATSPAGIPLFLDGTPFPEPFSVEGVTGIQRTVMVDDISIVQGRAYRFVGWSDGGGSVRSLVTPASDTTYTAYFIEDAASLGKGLTGAYYTDRYRSFGESPTFIMTGEPIHFNWGDGSPDPRISNDSFMVRWTGQIQAPTTGTYTFYTRTDDGTRLWVNHTLLVDKWENQPVQDWSGSIFLEGGRLYPIRMDYYEAGGGATAVLLWSGPTVTQQPVPLERLFPLDPRPFTMGEPMIESFEGDDYLTLTYIRPCPPPNGIRYCAESSGALHEDEWTSAVIVDGYPHNNEDGTETVKVRDVIPVTDDAPRFLRLRVETE